MSAIELAREGKNRRCVDCGGEPLFGGLRCLRDFQAKANSRLVLHDCVRHPASYWCYESCGCRCEGCRASKSEKQARYS